MKNYISILLLSLFILSCNQHVKKEKDISLIKDSLDQKFKEINQEGELVGFSVAILKPDQVLYNQGFGYANTKSQRKYQPNTIQNIGSVSKTLIGVSLFKAQELGKLKLDDPINNYLPFQVINPNFPNVAITIRQLATHTSSIVDEEENYLKAYILENEKVLKGEEVAFTHFQKPDKRISLFEFLKASLSEEGAWYKPEMFSKNKPGSTFEYTNFGADLCALIIAEATGMTYKDFTKKYIFDPLKMKDSGWKISELDSLKRSSFYLFKDTKIADYTCITYPNGGLFTSSEDLSKFLMELMKGYQGKGRLISKESYTELFEKQFDQIEENGRINAGHFIEYNNSFIGSTDLLIGHNGSDFGSFALMYFNPETEIGKIVMINTDIDYKDDVVVPYIKEVWSTMIENENKFNE